ncbi:MAG: ABC transporter substrate-binding protein [Fusobacteriaceae bacterium]
MLKKIEGRLRLISKGLCIFVLSAQAYGNIDLNFYTPFGGPDAKTMNTLIMKFNKENQGEIRIKPQSIDNAGGAYYEKLRLAAQSGTAPDVAVMHIDQLPLYSAMGILSEITPENLSKSGINSEEYVESVWKGTEYKNQRFAIPLDIHPLILWYNKNLVSEEQIPKTYEELVQKSKEFANANPGKYLFGMPHNPFLMSRTFYAALIQNGGKAITEDGLKAEYNSQEGVDALTKMSIFAQDRSLNPKVGADVVNMFKQGKIAMTLEGIWMTNAFKNMNVGAVSWEKMFGDKEKGIWASSHTFVIPKQEKGLIPEKQEAVLKFIKFINENSIEWAKAGQIPANKLVHQNPEFKKLPIQSKMAENLDSFLIFPASPTFAELWSGMERYSNEAIIGKKLPKEALDSTAKEGEAKAKKLTEILK